MRSLAALAVLLGAALAAAAEEKYPGPDDPATLAAARQALGHAKVLDIVGITRGIDGVLKDLGAKVTDREIRIELSADVLFDFDKADLRPEASVSLEKVAEVLRASPDAPVTIEGHTDGKGTDAYNQPLSERRAQSVKAWLVAHGGAHAAKITTRGWGKTKPVAPNAKPDGSDDPEGRKKNRRVEITVRTR
jgi:outer membrane protein OmpA-like peptidoglycan-associated protein